jgi:hypothetical protein
MDRQRVVLTQISRVGLPMHVGVVNINSALTTSRQTTVKQINLQAPFAQFAIVVAAVPNTFANS